MLVLEAWKHLDHLDRATSFLLVQRAYVDARDHLVAVFGLVMYKEYLAVSFAVVERHNHVWVVLWVRRWAMIAAAACPVLMTLTVVVAWPIALHFLTWGWVRWLRLQLFGRVESVLHGVCLVLEKFNIASLSAWLLSESPTLVWDTGPLAAKSRMIAWHIMLLIARLEALLVHARIAWHWLPLRPVVETLRLLEEVIMLFICFLSLAHILWLGVLILLKWLLHCLSVRIVALLCWHHRIEASMAPSSNVSLISLKESTLFVGKGILRIACLHHLTTIVLPTLYRILKFFRKRRLRLVWHHLWVKERTLNQGRVNLVVV